MHNTFIFYKMLKYILICKPNQLKRVNCLINTQRNVLVIVTVLHFIHVCTHFICTTAADIHV